MKDLRMLRPKQLCEVLSISVPTLYRWEAEGKVPIEKVRLGPGIVAYRRTDVEKWINGEFEIN